MEGIEREKGRVSRDDVGRMAAYSEFEELVVLGITASRYPHLHIDPRASEPPENFEYLPHRYISGTVFCSELRRVQRALEKKAALFPFGAPDQELGEASIQAGVAR